MQATRSISSSLDRMLTLNRAIDRAFNSGWTSEARVWVPAIDVVEKKDAYVLYAELPGVDASQLDITFEQNVLTVRGEKRSLLESNDQSELRVFAAERTTGGFERAVRLPEFIDGDKITADFTDGLLVVSVPKAQAAQPRRIEIKPGARTGGEVSDNGQKN